MIALLLFGWLAGQAGASNAAQHLQAGLNARNQHQVDVEIAEFRKATELDPRLADGFFNLGAAFMEKPVSYTHLLNIQRNLPWNVFVSAAYVGSKGTHLESYSQQIDQIGDNYLSEAATQCAAQVAASGARCNANGVALLQSVPNPFYDAATGTAYALGTATTTVGQLDRPYPQYTGLSLAGQGSYDSSYQSFQLLSLIHI